MADQRLSELPSANTVGPTDLLYLVQGDTSKKITVSSLVSLARLLKYDSSGTVLAWLPEAVPEYTTSTGVQGTVVLDTTHLYVCVATNTWKRAELSDW